MGDATRSFLKGFFSNLSSSIMDTEVTISAKLVVNGEGAWVVVCEDGTGFVHFYDGESDSNDERKGAEPARDYDCVVTFDRLQTILELAKGEIKPASAFLRRKVQYSGSIKKLSELRTPFEAAATETLADYGEDDLFADGLRAMLRRRGLKPSAKVTNKLGQTSVDHEPSWIHELTFLDKYHSSWESDSIDSRCTICKTKFGFLFRRHHCRICGKLCCSSCSTHRVLDKRVCTICFQDNVATPKPKSPRISVSQTVAEEKGSVKKLLTEPRRFIKKLFYEAYLPVAANTVDPKSSQMLGNGRDMLLRIRNLESKLAALKSRPIATIAVNFARKMLSRLLFLIPFVLSWLKLLHVFLDHSEMSTQYYCSLFFVIASSKLKSQNFLGLAVSVAWLHFRLNGNIGAITSLSSLFTVLAEWLSNFDKRNAIVIGLAMLPTLIHRYFGRLLHIYAMSFFIIGCYWSVKLVCVRLLGFSASKATRAYNSLDVMIAPYACNQILKLRSVFVKFGQYIGSRADIVPPHWNIVLSKLQDDMPADPPTYVRETIEAEFGIDMWEVFEDFTFSPIASASVAQVHEAVLRNGSGGDGLKVAVKVQHDGISDIMKSDFTAFSRIIDFISWLNPDFLVAKVFLRAWKTEMLKELDFNIEADNINAVRSNFRKHGFIVDEDDDYTNSVCEGSKILVPRVVKPLIAKKAFVMSFISGFKVTDLEQLTLFGVDRLALCRRIVQAYSLQLYVDGLFNADPHAGNLMVSITEDGQARPVLLDFGMVVTLPKEQRLGYAKLLNSISQLSVTGVSEGIAQVGYQNSQSSKHPIRDMEFFAHLLRDTGDRKESKKMNKTFRNRRQQQRKADLEQDSSAQGRRFKEFPDSLIFLFRVLGLIRGLCASLDVELSYIDIMGDYARYALMLEAESEIENSLANRTSSTNLSRGLKVSHLKPGQSLVKPMLQARLKKLLLGAVTETDCVGVQVACYWKGVLAAEATNVKTVESSTPFPLLDLSQILPMFALLHLVDKMLVDIKKPICFYWKEFPNSRATISHLLSNSAIIQDSLDGSIGVKFLADAAAVKKTLEAPLPDGGSKRYNPESDASYKVHAFGAIVQCLFSAVLPEENLEQYISREILSVSGSYTESEVVQTASVTPVAYASNAFAPMVRRMLLTSFVDNTEDSDTFLPPSMLKTLVNPAASNANTTEPIKKDPNAALDDMSSVKTNGERPKRPLPDERIPPGEDGDGIGMKLPSGVAIDPLMVNSKSLRENYIPSYGTFASARGLANLVNYQMMKSQLGKLIEPLTLAQENHPLFGEMQWNHGMQVIPVMLQSEKAETVVFARFAFGGSLVLTCPAKEFTIAVTVNNLTLERDLSRRVLELVFQEFGITTAASSLFGGMF